MDWLFDTSGFVRRWDCGDWPTELGYLHILSDVAIWAAYMTIPLALVTVAVRRRQRVPLPPLFWLFAGFLLLCGTIHLLDALMFYWPAYRFSGVLKSATAVISWGMVMMFLRSTPLALSMPALAKRTRFLEHQIRRGRRREERLARRRTLLEERVRERTKDLQRALDELRREVAERRRTEEQLRLREAQLLAGQRGLETACSERDIELNRQYAINSAIVESTDDAIIGKDHNATIISWNEGARRLYGYRAEEIIGSHVTTIMPEDRREEGLRLLHKALAGERVRHFETTRRRADGTIFDVSLTLSPLTVESGEVIGVSAIERDITEQVRSRQQMHEYAERLEASNQDLQQFAYVASHDLKAPLRAVSGYVQLIERRYADKLDDDARRFIRGAVESATQMQDLINALLSFSRIQRAEKKFTTVDLNGTLAKAQGNLKVDIEESGAEVTIQELPTIQGNPNLLIQLFQNLIGNAIKFRGDQPPHVAITAEKVDNEWVVSVADNGIGLDPRYSEKVFEIFKRLHSTRRYQGTGIGLAICRRIAQHHGGRIWVESEVGAGSTFHVSFPVKG